MRPQTAMKLCKESGNQEFMFWAAVAMNFQVPQDAMGPAPVLNIAEMMMKKAVDAVSAGFRLLLVLSCCDWMNAAF